MAESRVKPSRVKGLPQAIDHLKFRLHDLSHREYHAMPAWGWMDFDAVEFVLKALEERST